MDKTISEKIFSRASKKDVYAEDIVIAEIDGAMAHDGTALLAIEAFEKFSGKKIWDSSLVNFIIDHVSPSASEVFSKVHKKMREFSRKHNIRFFDVGSGVCHQLMIENRFAYPGALIVGSDSHTCTYGGIGAFATGIGSTEMAAVWLSGKLWFKVPDTMKIWVEGVLPKMVYPKDLILKIVGEVKADGATYKAIEFTGPTLNSISVDGRLTLCNMAVEMGAKTGIINPDEKTYRYMTFSEQKNKFNFRSDLDANFSEKIKVDVSELEPQVACPHNVDNVKSVSSVEGVKIDQAFLGSCTNGRLEDLRIAAQILQGKKIRKEVRMIVAPASRSIYLEALHEGLIEIFIKAGCTICNPGCGPCVGAHQGILAPDEVCLSTSNRNFQGRMGCMESKIYLSSPVTLAFSAIEGEITDPRRILKR